MYGWPFTTCLLLVIQVTLAAILVTASSIPDTRDNMTESDAEGEDTPLKQEMTQMRNELLTALREGLGQLREEVNAKTAIGGSVGRTFYVPPHHFHHYYHHAWRPPVYRVDDMDASDELSTLRELLEATENRLRTTELSLQETQAKLLTLENRLDTEVDEPQATQSRPQSCQDKLIATQERLESAERKLALVDDTISSADALSITVRNQASTFVRWGRTQCPSNTQLVYSGTAGGSRYDYKGAAANHLCLTMEPEFDGTSLPDKYTYLQGAEYEDIEGHLNHDVPCSVCRAPQSTTIMVPATLTCSPGWVSQYTGYLVAGHHTHAGAGEFLCLDGEPEHMPGGHEDKNGALFYQTVTSCGSLPCPPYVGGKVVTCVVCSM